MKIVLSMMVLGVFLLVGVADMKRIVTRRDTTGATEATKFDDPSHHQQFVDLHDTHRRAEGATDMNCVEWSDTLAQMAQASASSCHFGHGNMDYNATNKIGQNIMLMTKTIPDFSDYSDIMARIEELVNVWYDEKQWYTMATDTCATGKLCGHYKQVVESRVRFMGCGVQFCESVTQDGTDGFNNQYLVFCDYDKGVIENTLPYTPGEACTECRIPPGTTCDDGLCVQCNPSEDPTCTPYECYLDPRVRDRSASCPDWKSRCWRAKYKTACPKTCKVCPDSVYNTI